MRKANYRHIRINRKSSVVVLIAVLSGVILLSACGSDNGELDVTITDGYCSTLITASSGETVASVLSRAEIELCEDDSVSPKEDEVITEDCTSITISRTAQVSITENGELTELTMLGATVSDAIAEAGITLGEYDVVNHSLDAYLVGGMEIEVEHWYQVNITVSGEESTVITQAKTVGELLNEQGIEIAEDDRVSPDADTAIESNGIEVTVQYVSTREEVVETAIAYETVYEDSDSLYIGETEVSQEGQDGTLSTTYVITYVDGIEESRTETESIVTAEPVDEIILVGTKEEEVLPEPESESEDENVSSDGRVIVSKQKVYDCDGSGNGYYIITYEDGSVEYEDFYDPYYW